MPQGDGQLINHGISTSSTSDESLSISELYMNNRFIPLDQLKEALTTTVLCPSASSEMIEDVLELLLLSDPAAAAGRAAGTNDEASEKYHYNGGSGRANSAAEEMLRNGCCSSSDSPTRMAKSPNVTVNMSTSSLSATDYVPVGAGQKIHRDDEKINLVATLTTHKKDDADKKKSNDSRMETDHNGATLQISFAGTAARIVAELQPPKSEAQFEIADIVLAAQRAALADVAEGGKTISDYPQTDEFLNQQIKINFRTWCGIVAFAERFTTSIQKDNDTKHEVRGCPISL